MIGTFYFTTLLLLSIWVLVADMSSINHEHHTHEHTHEHFDYELLESLAFKFGTDKSKDDHGYVDTYASLLEGKRHHPLKMCEIGVAVGQSIQMWHAYFTHPDYRLYGIDNNSIFESSQPAVANNLKKLSRFELIIGDATVKTQMDAHFTHEQLDVIIDDGDHWKASQESVLAVMWDYLKPGGLYIIEDVDAQRGGFDFHEKPDKLQPYTRQIMTENHAFWVDAHIGHRMWDEWLKRIGPDWGKNHRVHNSYMLVIRKRRGAQPPLNMHIGKEAMNVNAILTDTPEIIS